MIASRSVNVVEGMLDKSKGTLRLFRDALGDERVPSLSLCRLKQAYREGRGSVRSWTTAGLFRPGHGTATSGALLEVGQGRLGVLSSTDAFLFHFRMKPSTEDRIQIKSSPKDSGLVTGRAVEMATLEEAEELEGEGEFHLVYLWLGREAGAEARAAARAQLTPLLEVEQGCEPALFLALFSYMLPPLAAVVLQGREQRPDLRQVVLELQESPCLHGSGIALAVEGDASLLAKHGPLPGRSYVILVRPRQRRIESCGSSRSGSGSSEGGRGGSGVGRGGEAGRTGGVAAFDEGYYWHGVGETPAVEGVGILLCQQVDRMFPSALTTERSKRRGTGRSRRIGVANLGCGMMRGYVVDVKLGLPVPDGFWACILPATSALLGRGPGDRKLLSQDLSPGLRSRPVRVFGVCAENKKSRQSFVWEVTCGGMPSQMRLSPSLSHVVDAGGSVVYVWHGAGSHGDGRRLALRVARAYVMRVEGGAKVEEADAGSEPVGLLDCFIGKCLVPREDALFELDSRSSSMTGALSWRNTTPTRPSGNAADVSPLTTPTTATSASRGSSWSIGGSKSRPGGCEDQDQRRRCVPASRTSSGSNSSASRLTPPGQRTPPLRVNSPPSLKHVRAGEGSPSCCSPAATASAEGSGSGFPAKSEACTAAVSPPRRRSAAFDSLLARYDGSIGRDSPVGREDNGAAAGSPLSLSMSPPNLAPRASVLNIRAHLNATVTPRSVLPCHADRENLPGSTRERVRVRESVGESVDVRERAKARENASKTRCDSAREIAREGVGDEYHYTTRGELSHRRGDADAVYRRQTDGGIGLQEPSGAGRDSRRDLEKKEGEGYNSCRNVGKMGGGRSNVDNVNRCAGGTDDGGGRSEILSNQRGVEFCEGAGSLRRAVSVAVAPGNVRGVWPSCGGRVRNVDNGRGSSEGVGGDGVAPSRHLSDFFRSPLSLDSTSTPAHRLSYDTSPPDVQTGAVNSAAEVQTEAVKSPVEIQNGAVKSLADMQTGVSLLDRMKSATSDESGAHAKDSSILVNAEQTESSRSPPDVQQTGSATSPADEQTGASLFDSVKSTDAQQQTEGVKSLADANTRISLFDSMKSAASDYSGAHARGSSILVDAETFDLTSGGGRGDRKTEIGNKSEVDPGDNIGDGGRPPRYSVLFAESVAGNDGRAEIISSPPAKVAEDALVEGNVDSARTIIHEGGRAVPDFTGNVDPAREIVLDRPPSGVIVQLVEPVKAAVGAEKDGVEGGEREHPPDKTTLVAAASSSSEEPRGKDAPASKKGGALKSLGWAGLDEDGMWRSEVARRAAGQAGAMEANRRRLAKISRDKSWRSDAVAGGGDKLHMFEGNGSSTVKDKCGGNRSSIGALNGRGLVSTWSERKMIAVEEHTSADSTRSGSGSNSRTPWLEEGGMKLRRPRPDQDDEMEHKDVDFLWKQGPSPPPLKGRPSLGLIRTGQVRIMSKQLARAGRGNHAKTCAEGGASGGGRGGWNRFQEKKGGGGGYTPAKASGAASTLDQEDRKQACGAPHGDGGDGCMAASLAAQGHFWLAKAGFGRKKLEAAEAAAAPATAVSMSAPVSPVRDVISAWSKGGGTRTPPPKYVPAAAAVARGNQGGAAAVKGTRGGRYRFPTWGSGKKLS
eukprot:jgi/Undpi1/2005/HiC_scaffold_12.g05392.m1